ncbi:hypothetical protein MT418_003308 [Batrachochytrium dendrobatidis]
MTSMESSLGLWENFVESIAQVLSQALTDQETEKLVSSFTVLQHRLRQLSADNLHRLESKGHRKSLICKHHGTCTANTVRAFVRAFVVTYGLKYALGFFPALLTGKAFSKPRILLRIGGQDTISFALFMSVFISSYKGFLCTFRAFCGSNDKLNSFMAGTLAGFSLLLDSNKSRRVMIALYLSTRTTHFLSRWIWRAYLARWSAKLGYHNPNTIVPSKSCTAECHADSEYEQLQIQVPQSADVAQFQLGDGSWIGSSTTDVDFNELSPSIDSKKVGVNQIKTLHEPTHMPKKNDCMGSLGSDRNMDLVQSPLSDKATSNQTQHALNHKHHRSDQHSMHIQALNTRAEELILNDVDDKHHTHHPLRKLIRQASAVLVMMLSSSQILNAYVTEPETLANSYFSFLLTHGGIRSLQPKRPREYIALLGDIVRSCTHMESTKFLDAPPGTPFAETVPVGVSVESFEKFKDFITQTPHEFLACALQHPASTNCWYSVLWSFKGEWFRAMSLYAPLNLIMMLIFRGKRVLNSPLRSLFHLGFSILRSTVFLTCYVTAAWTLPCLFRWLKGRDLPWMYYVNGMVAGSMVLIEVPGRRLELALYCLPRAIESFYNSLAKQGYAQYIKNGEALYFCLSTGVLMTLYQSDPGSIHEGYRKVMFRYFGVN